MDLGVDLSLENKRALLDSPGNLRIIKEKVRDIENDEVLVCLHNRFTSCMLDCIIQK